ncbi:uroporphyrinogen-III synthase [Methylococcales bacterium]|nr:uroporphyrinogen-III synthase [Methylococcales bacterium]
MAALPAGFGVLVTRPAAQAEALCRMVREGGGTAIRVPLLEIEAAAISEEGPCRLGRLDGLDWLVFVSVNAVRCAFELLGPQWLEACPAKIATIGHGTALALAERGIAVDLKPKQQSNSEALLAESEWLDVAGQKFLIVRGEGGRERLAEVLRMRGGLVEYAEVYRRQSPSIDAQGLISLWRAGGIDVVTVTSGEALDRLAQVMADGAGDLLANTPLVVIGERLATRARELGCTQVTAAGASDADIFDAVVRIGQALINTHQTRG